MKNRYVITALLNLIAAWQDAQGDPHSSIQDNDEGRPPPLRRSSRVGWRRDLEVRWWPVEEGSPTPPPPPPNTPVVNSPPGGSQ